MTSRNSPQDIAEILPATYSAAQVADGLGVTEYFVKTNYKTAGIRPLLGSKKQPRFTASDIAQFIEWMRERPGRAKNAPPETVTSKGSASRHKGRAA